MAVIGAQGGRELRLVELLAVTVRVVSGAAPAGRLVGSTGPAQVRQISCFDNFVRKLGWLGCRTHLLLSKWLLFEMFQTQVRADTHHFHIIAFKGLPLFHCLQNAVQVTRLTNGR